MGGYPVLRDDPELASVLAQLEAAGVNYGQPAAPRQPSSWADLAAFGPGGSGGPPPQAPQPQPVQAPINWADLSQFAQQPVDDLAAAVPPLQSAYQAPEDMRYVPAGGRRGHQAGFEEALRTVGQEALPLALGPLGRLAGMAPRLSMAGAAMVTDPSRAGGQGRTRATPSREVEKLQRMLRDTGYLDATFPIDGISGPKTIDAKQRFERDEQARRESDLRTQELQAVRDREQNQIAREAADRAAGEKQDARIKELTENTPLWQKFAPWLGLVAGGLGGYAGRAGLGKVAGQIEQRGAERANALLEGVGGRGRVDDRVGALNQFWREGGAPSAQAPFSMAPGARPPWAPNPNAMPAADLYRTRPPLANYGPGGAMMGTGAAEFGAGYFGGVLPYREEVAAAQAALKTDKSEAAIERYEAARRNLAFAEAFANMGRGTMGGAFVGELKGRVKHYVPRPNVGIADAERAKLDRLVSPKLPPAKPRARRSKSEADDYE